MALLQLPPLPLPRLHADGALAMESRSTGSSSSASASLSTAPHGSVVCEHLSFSHFLGGYRKSAPRSHLRITQGHGLSSQRFLGVRHGDGARLANPRRAQGSKFTPQHSSDGYLASRSDARTSDSDPELSSGGEQDRYSSPRPGSLRLDSRRTQGNDFSAQRSAGGRQKEYDASPSDSRRPRENDFTSHREFGGRQDAYSASRSNSGRTQANNYNSQRFPGGGRNGNATSGLDSRRRQGDNSYSERGSQAGYARGSYAGRGSSRRSDALRTGSGQDRDKLAGRSRSSKTPNPITQTITPRQSTSEFFSDRTVHRAPWEQGAGRDSNSRSAQGNSERDFTERNPLVERLQRMQEEVENDNADEDDDFASLDDNRGFSGLDDDDALDRFDERGEKSAMARIVEKLRNIPGSPSVYEPRRRGRVGVQEGPDSDFGPKYGQPMFPAVGRGWSTPDHPVPTAAAPSERRFRPDTRFPWEREDDRSHDAPLERLTRVKPPSLAELTLPEEELKRLRSLGILTRHRIKVGKLGVTNGIVESIHNEWRNSEVVRIKCEGPPAQNMKRTHEALEERTGGLVVWRAGGACLVYRGKDYVPPPLQGLYDFSEESKTKLEASDTDEKEAESIAGVDNDEVEDETKMQPAEAKVIVPRVNSIYDPELEREMEEILSTLGPRYHDWTGMKPVPVDADLLIASGGKFKKPFRLLPYGVKPKLSNLEMTNLRRIGRPLPPHFVLGLNKGLDGLAAAIVKLWEKSEVAKIAVKRGIQNTSHERMAEQLKRLTGGVLLARDKFFIVLYRGKDFLPTSVAEALEERQAMTTALQEEEEKVRLLPQNREVLDTTVERSIAGTLAESLQAKANWETLQNSDEERKLREEVRKAAKNDMTRRIQRRVFITTAKKNKAEMELRKVEKRLRPAGPPVDRENITDEERHMYSKLGLKMHAFLLLGRRGVFDGTVENMHLHWKHRELVKIIYKATDRIDLEQTARMLEYESGGILVATIPTNKGQAIIVYRGKNYQRPPELRPRTLLTKRQALKRSIEMQRQKALTKHLLALEKEIENMQADLSKLEAEEEGDKGDMEERYGEPSASDVKDLPEPEESKEPTISSGFESPKEDVKLMGNGDIGHLSKQGEQDIIFRADPLSRREKLILRHQALKEQKRTAHFNVGRSNVVAGLARAIRIHFQKHALVKVGVRGRARGTPVEEILYQLEAATGGTLVSHELSKVILYRGWPDGQKSPTDATGHWEELPPELRRAMISEVEADDDYLHESDWNDSSDEDDKMGLDEENEKDFFRAQASVDESEVDDDMEWDDVEEDDDEGDFVNESVIGLGQDEDEEQEQDAREKFIVSDVV